LGSSSNPKKEEEDIVHTKKSEVEEALLPELDISQAIATMKQLRQDESLTQTNSKKRSRDYLLNESFLLFLN